MIAPTDIAQNIHILTSMSRTELKITNAFLWFFKEKLLGKHTYTAPERETIARIANCSLGSVKLFINKFDDVLLNHETRRNFKTNRHTSNLYKFNVYFFEWLVLFDAAGFFGRLLRSVKYALKILKEQIWKLYMENEWFIHEMLYRNPLMNTIFSHGVFSKLATTKSFLLLTQFLNKFVLKIKPKSYEEKMAQEKKDSVFEDVTLSFSQKKRLLEKFSLNILKASIGDYQFARKNEHIHNPESYIYICARARVKKSLKL